MSVARRRNPEAQNILSPSSGLTTLRMDTVRFSKSLTYTDESVQRRNALSPSSGLPKRITFNFKAFSAMKMRNVFL
jgi:hypothetical protein